MKRIDQKVIHGLNHLLRQFCWRHPVVLRRAKTLIDVKHLPVLGALNRGRGRNGTTHAVLVQMSEE